MANPFDSIETKAARGDVQAMTTLGKRLTAEPNSAKDAESGQALLQKAMDAGSGEAAEFIAVLLASGMAGQQNWALALDYLAHAASLGWAPALAQMSCLADGSDQSDLRTLHDGVEIDALLQIPERQSLCDAPRIRKFEDFIPDRFCVWMIDKARPELVRARTYDDVDSAGRKSDARTNSAASFGLLDLDLILLLIQTKITKITDVPLFAMEKSMVFQYKAGEEFREHHDYLDPSKPAQAADMRQFGQRLATCLIYLNDEFEGAETAFPKINRKFRCDQGGALLFANIDMQGQPDPQTLHAGLAPTKGEKWLLSQWIRSGPMP